MQTIRQLNESLYQSGVVKNLMLRDKAMVTSDPITGGCYDVDDPQSSQRYFDQMFALVENTVLATKSQEELKAAAADLNGTVTWLWRIDKARMTKMAGRMKAHADTLG